MDSLTQDITLRSGVRVPGRIALAPLTNTQSHPDGTLGDDELRWLARRAEGGFSWLSTCAAFVSPEGKAWQGQLGIAGVEHLPGLTRLASTLRERGATPFVQLHHGGALAKLAPGRPLTAAEATEDDLRRVIDDFAAAARRAEVAGFAGVEIHGANGYLLTQLLAPLDNTRDDAWGGDLAGRARLVREVLRAARAATSPGFAVGIRLNPTDLFAARGITLEDSLQTARWAAEDGADWIHLSMRSAVAPSAAAPDAPPIARLFRDALPAEVALVTAGGVWTRADAYRALDAGADVIAVGKAAIIHPAWPRASADAAFAPSLPPWHPDDLRHADVGDALLTYLSGFPGLMSTGAPPRPPVA